MRKFLFFLCVFLIPCPVYAAYAKGGASFSARAGLEYGTVNLSVEMPADKNLPRGFSRVSYSASSGKGEPAVSGVFKIGNDVTQTIHSIGGLRGGTAYDFNVTLLDENGKGLSLTAVRGVTAQPFGSSSLDRKTFTVETAEQLENIRRLEVYDGGCNFNLAADINLRGEWTPIGNERRAFKNNFNGGGYTVRNLKADGKNLTGLFGKIEDAEVTDLKLDGVYSNGKLFAGSLAGEAVNCLIENVNVTNSTVKTYGNVVEGLTALRPTAGGRTANGLAANGSFAGGLVGTVRGRALEENFNHGAKINNCEVSAKVVSAKGNAGGLAGGAFYALMENSSSSGSVKANEGYAGGFAGSMDDRSRAKDCATTASVSAGTGAAGGFIGILAGESCVEFSSASGSVSSTGAAGGFAGTVSNDGAPNTVTECYSFAPWVIGGDKNVTHRFAGRLLHNGVNNCYAGLGVMVSVNGELVSVAPGAFGADGADVSRAESRAKKLALPDALR